MLTVASAQHKGPADIRTPDNVTGKASAKAGEGNDDGDEEEQEDDDDEVEPAPEPEPESAIEPPSKKRRIADIEDEPKPTPKSRPNPLGSTVPLRPAAVSRSPSPSSRAPSADSERHPDSNLTPTPPPHPKPYASRAPFPPQGIRTGGPLSSGSGSRDAYGADVAGGRSQAPRYYADACPESSHPRYHPQTYPLGAFGRAAPAPAPSHSYPHPYTYVYNDVPRHQEYQAHTQYPGSSDGAHVVDFFAAILGASGDGAGLKQEDLSSGLPFDWPVHNHNQNHESARRPTATSEHQPPLSRLIV